jgi:hypothetical protein
MKPSINQRWTQFRVCEPVNPTNIRSKRGGIEYMVKNQTHTVIVAGDDRCENPLDGWVLLSIRRNDRAAECDWRIFMRIKTDLVGPDREAIQLFPGMRRVVDTANQYFLFVAPKGYVFGLGQFEQEVSDEKWAESVGATQRPFDEDDLLRTLVNNAPRSETVNFFPVPLYPEKVIELMRDAFKEPDKEDGK